MEQLSMRAARTYQAPMEHLSRLKAMPGHYIRRAQQVSSAIFAQELAGTELTSVQLVALAAIADCPGLDATRLAEMIDFDKATIGGVIDRLERKKLITRAVSTADRRVKELVPSPEGRAILAASMASVERVQERLLAPLEPAEREKLNGMLRAIIGLS